MYQNKKASLCRRYIRVPHIGAFLIWKCKFCREAFIIKTLDSIAKASGVKLALPNVAPIIGGGLTIVFIVFCWKMWKQGSLRIQKLLNEDFEA